MTARPRTDNPAGLAPPPTLTARFDESDLALFTPQEMNRFFPDATLPWERLVNDVAWELLYRKEPELYERLVAPERLHEGIWEALPQHMGRVVEVGAGAGRLTIPLAARAEEVIAIEPAAPMRDLLMKRLADHGLLDRVEVRDGFFDALPVSDGWADSVVACSTFTSHPSHGGEPGLAEAERVSQGSVIIVWPTDNTWLAEHGFRTIRCTGDVYVEFPSVEEAEFIAEIFYPWAVDTIRSMSLTKVPYDLLRMTPPDTLCWKTLR